MPVEPLDSAVPSIRIRLGNERNANAEGDFILYWMTSFRRVGWNFSLQRAVDWARALKKPLVVFEPLRCGYRWASDRLHQFVIEGMVDNGRRLAGRPVHYYPYLEPKQGAGKKLLAALARHACVVVGDDFPCFFLPRMVAAAASQIPVRFELIDSNGLLPMGAANKVFQRAFDFRRFLQKTLKAHLSETPLPDPLRRVRLPRLRSLPKEILRKWSAADLGEAVSPGHLQRYPIDHSVAVTSAEGGSKAAGTMLEAFLSEKLPHYEEQRNQPEQDVTSGLSPYLHFGHVSAHEVFSEIMEREGWSVDQAAEAATGSARGWWNVSGAAEGFLDQLITWRELGFNLCSRRGDYAKYESLPEWALETLAEHARDRRDHVYSLEEFESAATHDGLWNAAQRQLVREGRMHNYLRMLWGKKILEWTAQPREALDVMIELNNKYALDGRDPNSYSGIFWVLGRYDRAWGPERPIFGKVRYMSSQNTARKVRVKEYMRKYGKGDPSR